MKTEFLNIIEKGELMAKVISGDDMAIKTMFNELARLEGVVKDYEIGIEAIIGKFESRTFKTPKRFKEVENEVKEEKPTCKHDYHTFFNKGYRKCLRCGDEYPIS